MSQAVATAKEEKRPEKGQAPARDIRAALESDAVVWLGMQANLMTSLEPWLKIQADLARRTGRQSAGPAAPALRASELVSHS